MSESNSNTSTPQSFLSWEGSRVRTAYDAKFLSELWLQERNNYAAVLAQAAWAAGNSVNVGMTETAEVLNAMLAQPSTEQIYTTQPQWGFREGQQLIIGSYVDINASGTRSAVTYANGVWLPATPPTGYTRYAIPSLIYDKRGSSYPHVVFPAWIAVWDGHYIDDEGALIDSQYEDSVYAGTGDNEGRYFCEDLDDEEVWLNYVFGFHPIVMTYRHNCNYFGGGLDGFVWAEVATSGTWSGSNVQVTVNAYQKPGTFCRINGTDCGIVTAVLDNGDDTYTLTLGCLCGLVAAGTTVTKVELYKPVGQ